MSKLLRFYLSSTDTYHHQSVYDLIARSAKRYGIAGATVFRGSMGFGLSSELRSDKFWEFNIKQPIVIDMVDEEAKLKGFLDSLRPMLEELPKGFLITMQEVDVVMQKAGPKK